MTISILHLVNAKRHKIVKPLVKKFSPYEEAINRNLKEYYEEKNRLLKSLLYFDTYDWMEVNSPEILD